MCSAAPGLAPFCSATADRPFARNWIIATIALLGWGADRLAGLGWAAFIALFAAVLPALLIRYGIRRWSRTGRHVGIKRERLAFHNRGIPSPARPWPRACRSRRCRAGSATSPSPRRSTSAGTWYRRPAHGPVTRSTGPSPRRAPSPRRQPAAAHGQQMCKEPRRAAHRRCSEAQKGVSRPVGRVLCARLRGPTVIHLGLPLPTASCGLPASIGRAALERSRRSVA